MLAITRSFQNHLFFMLISRNYFFKLHFKTQLAGNYENENCFFRVFFEEEESSKKMRSGALWVPHNVKRGI